MSRKSERIGRFAAAVGEEPVFVGVDVYKRTYSVALFCATDGQVETWNCPADEAGLVEQLRGLGCHVEHVVYETGPTGFSLCRALREAGFNASVIAASRIPRGAAAAAKSDRVDATKLAIYFARGLLRPVAVPTVEEEGYRALVRRRKRVSEARAKVKQKIKSLLLATGIAEPTSLKRWIGTAAADLAALDLDTGTRPGSGFADPRVPFPAGRASLFATRGQQSDAAAVPRALCALDAGRRGGRGRGHDLPG